MGGHVRVYAGKRLGLESVPIGGVSDRSDHEVRAYILADNKVVENAGGDAELGSIELQGLIDLDCDVESIGLTMTEIDLIIEGEQTTTKGIDDRLDALEPVASGPAITRTGDLWQLGPHLLRCGDARSKQDVARVCSERPADLLFTDPPYNVRIDGHVSGLGKVRHREFFHASGEMDEATFTYFLRQALAVAVSYLKDGAIAYVCMDWRHMGEVLAAGKTVFTEFKNLCVWNETNGGMGSFYRSKHELVFVFKHGSAPHVNNFGLGEGGRYRTNVWDYPGISSLGANRAEEQAMHPTVKPVALVADAIRDCTRRNEIVLDLFGGSGSTLIAADQCGRQARLVELDPHYCDTIIWRFEKVTGERARLKGNGFSFEDAECQRSDTTPEESNSEKPGPAPKSAA